MGQQPVSLTDSEKKNPKTNSDECKKVKEPTCSGSEGLINLRICNGAIVATALFEWLILDFSGLKGHPDMTSPKNQRIFTLSQKFLLHKALVPCHFRNVRGSVVRHQGLKFWLEWKGQLDKITEWLTAPHTCRRWSIWTLWWLVDVSNRVNTMHGHSRPNNWRSG